LKHTSDINNNYKFRLGLTEHTLHLHHKHQLVSAAYDDKSLGTTCPTLCGLTQICWRQVFIPIVCVSQNIQMSSCHN